MIPFTALLAPHACALRVYIFRVPRSLIAPGLYNYGEVEDYTINLPSAGPYDLGSNGHYRVFIRMCGLGITPLTVNITNLGNPHLQVRFR